MGDRKLTVLRDKVEEQRKRLGELERFRERGGLPLPYTDLYQFPKPGSTLSATQLTEVAGLLQSTIRKTERESKRLRENLAAEKSETLRQRTLILGLEQAVRDRARTFGCGGETEECITALRGNRIGKDTGRLRSDIIRAEAREKELTICVSTMESLATGMETAAEFIEKNRKELGKVQKEIEELQETVGEIKQYIDSTRETEGEVIRLEKAAEKNKIAYKNLTDYRYRLESRSRILEKDVSELAAIRDFHTSLYQENRHFHSNLASFASEISLMTEATSVLSAQLTEAEEDCEEKCTTPRFLSDERTEIELAMELTSQRQHSLQQDLIQKINDSKKLKQKLWESEKSASELRAAYGLTRKEEQNVFRELTNLRERSQTLAHEKASSSVSASVSASQQQSELQSAQRRTESLKHDLQEANCLLAALRTELAATKSACESLPSAQSSLASLQHNLQEVRHLVDISQKEITAISDDLSVLRQRASV